MTLLKFHLTLIKNVMIMNQNCYDEPNKKSHTNTPDHHRPKKMPAINQQSMTVTQKQEFSCSFLYSHRISMCNTR
jgi:hypothetical protein